LGKRAIAVRDVCAVAAAAERVGGPVGLCLAFDPFDRFACRSRTDGLHLYRQIAGHHIGTIFDDLDLRACRLLLIHHIPPMATTKASPTSPPLVGNSG